MGLLDITKKCQAFCLMSAASRRPDISTTIASEAKDSILFPPGKMPGFTAGETPAATLDSASLPRRLQKKGCGLTLSHRSPGCSRLPIRIAACRSKNKQLSPGRHDPRRGSVVG